MDYGFPKVEHLCHQKIIGQLIGEGKGITSYPFRMVFLETELPEPVPYQVAFSVAKRRFRKAVDRNRLKRVMREVWRHSRPQIIQLANGKSYAFLVIYISNDKMNTAELEAPFQKLLSKWEKEIGSSL